MKRLVILEAASAIAILLSIGGVIISLLGVIWSDNIIWSEIGLTSIIMAIASYASFQLLQKVQDEMNNRKQ